MKRFFLFLIRFYRRNLSRRKKRPACRYVPTCSEYAVTRNRIKRRLRECFRPYLGDVKTGLYVIVARPSAAEAAFDELKRDVRYLLKKQDALLKHPSGTPGGSGEGNRAQ